MASSVATTKNDSDFGLLTLVDSYHPAIPDGRETQAEPAGTSVSQQILGRTAWVLTPQDQPGTVDTNFPNGHMQASYVAFVMAKNKGLVPRLMYWNLIIRMMLRDKLPF